MVLSAERLDLFIGPEDVGDDDVTKLPFDYLGYITLSDNQSTDYKSRELKSITVPAFNPTSYVKFRLHQNHHNSLNVFNQVTTNTPQLEVMPTHLSHFC